MVGLAGLLPSTWLMSNIGDKARDILLRSRLPPADLHQIWFVNSRSRGMNEANY